MIICFDLSNNKILFIKQQNTKSSFAVDFLYKENSKSFSELLEKALLNDVNLLSSLKQEKNTIILPDKIIGFDMFNVPSVKFGKNNYFETRFNALYNKSNDLNVVSQILNRDKEQTLYNFYYVKKEIIDSLSSLFKRYNLKLNGISFYSQSVLDYVISTNKQLSKGNVIFAQNSSNFVNLYAVNNGVLLGYQQINLKSDSSITKKYANSLKLRRRNVKLADAEEIEMLTKYKNETTNQEMLAMYIKDFTNNFGLENLNFNFNSICLINFLSDFKNNLPFEKVFEINGIDEELILSKSKTNVFVTKRGFWL